jgi:ADP-dependent phosphofructokinase/glucokinase
VWPRPANAIELVASLVRQVALGGGASRQLGISPELSRWLDDTLRAAGFSPKKAMGGAGAFAANLAAALGVDAKFFSAGKVPSAIAERFAPGVQLVDKAGAAHAPDEHADEAPARVNLSLEYGKGEALALFGKTTALVNGAEVSLVPGGNSRVIVGALAKDVRPGLQGVDDATLRKLAQRSDVFFFVGAHYLTQASSADAAAAEAGELARALRVMKQQNPALVIHAQYVVPKVFEHEPAVWGALKGAIDSLALNVVEAAPFVDALVDGGQLLRSLGDPAHMLEGALAIADGMALSRVHLHGLEGDLVISRQGAPGAKDPERQTLALLKARQLAANKAANDSGEIKTAEDIFPVVPSVRGTGLAALHRFADALQERYGLTVEERDRVVERWWWKNPADGTVIHFVPSRGIHDRTGGTISLGDTIDAGGLMFAIEGRAPKLKHGSSFA